MRSDNMVNENLAVLLTDGWWDMACQISCLSCHTKNDEKISDNKLTCRECEEQQYVAKPCCSNITSRERFFVKFNERYADCSICRPEMIRLPCCDQFQPKIGRNMVSILKHRLCYVRRKKINFTHYLTCDMKYLKSLLFQCLDHTKTKSKSWQYNIKRVCSIYLQEIL